MLSFALRSRGTGAAGAGAAVASFVELPGRTSLILPSLASTSTHVKVAHAADDEDEDDEEDEA